MPVSSTTVLSLLSRPTELVLELISLIDTQLSNPSRCDDLVLSLNGRIIYSIQFHSALNSSEQRYIKEAYQRVGWEVRIHTSSQDNPILIELTSQHTTGEPIPLDSWQPSRTTWR